MDQPTPSFEEKLTELEQILAQLESGELPLSTWIERHIKGKQLIADLDQSLKEAAQALEVIDLEDNES